MHVWWDLGMRLLARLCFSTISIKGAVSGCKGHMLLVSETFESTAQRDVKRVASTGSIAGRMAPTTPIAVIQSSRKHRNED